MQYMNIPVSVKALDMALALPTFCTKVFIADDVPVEQTERDWGVTPMALVKM